MQVSKLWKDCPFATNNAHTDHEKLWNGLPAVIRQELTVIAAFVPLLGDVVLPKLKVLGWHV